MKTIFFKLAIIILAALILSPTPVSAFTGKVIRVSDGDTITVMHEGERVKIRLAGIDTPESAQPGGMAAKRFLADLVEGKTVELKPETKDRYGRTVGEIFLDGKSTNQAIVAAGHAWHYKQYSNDATLARLENEAKDARKGLWAARMMIASLKKMVFMGLPPKV